MSVCALIRPVGRDSFVFIAFHALFIERTPSFFAVFINSVGFRIAFSFDAAVSNPTIVEPFTEIPAVVVSA